MSDLLDPEAWENTLDDAWPREGGRAHIIRVLAQQVVAVLAARGDNTDNTLTDNQHGNADEHVCATKPLCDGWPYGPDDAFRTIAAVSNPGERKENRDGWAVTMRHRPALFEREAKRATERLHAAIAHARAVIDGPTTKEQA